MPRNIEQIDNNNNQMEKELKDLLLRDAVICQKITSVKNSVILATEKQM
jgi:hypothetical protein